MVVAGQVKDQVFDYLSSLPPPGIQKFSLKIVISVGDNPGILNRGDAYPPSPPPPGGDAHASAHLFLSICVLSHSFMARKATY